MSKGNDLIERLRGAIAHADSDISDALLDAETTGELIDPDDWHVEVPVNWLRDVAATIASLSEALAEAEKKGLERAAVYVEKCGDWRMEIGQQHKQDPHTGPCAQEQFWLLEAAKGIRGLTQGGSNE